MQRRYLGEVLYTDGNIGNLLGMLEQRGYLENTIVLFYSDHGESLGEHGYWGHGRNLYEPTLHIPMGIVWPGKIASETIDSPALITDLAPTVLGLLSLEIPDFFQGYDWTGVLTGDETPSAGRVTTFQAHKGSVSPKEQQVELRQRGLLQVARIVDERKEIVRVGNLKRWEFDLVADPKEETNLDSPQSEVSAALEAWLETVRAGLLVSDELPPPSFSDEDAEALKALGYLE